MSELLNAAQFVQGAFTILLSLAFGEAFKQLVPDGDHNIRWDRVSSLLAFIALIFPFFHGMNRHFFRTYLAHPSDLSLVEARLMFDGVSFLIMSAMFFVMSRSLSPTHWIRFFGALTVLLFFDTIWAGVSISLGDKLWPFIYMNCALLFIMAVISTISYFLRRPTQASQPTGAGATYKFSWGPTFWCALACFMTTITDYYWMESFFFSK